MVLDWSIDVLILVFRKLPEKGVDGHSSIEASREVLDVWIHRTLNLVWGRELLVLEDVSELVLQDGLLEKLLFVIEASNLFVVVERGFFRLLQIVLRACTSVRHHLIVQRSHWRKFLNLPDQVLR